MISTPIKAEFKKFFFDTFLKNEVNVKTLLSFKIFNISLDSSVTFVSINKKQPPKLKHDDA